MTNSTVVVRDRGAFDEDGVQLAESNPLDSGSSAPSFNASACLSDRRLKANIEKIGELDDGLGVYEFDYVWGGRRQRGVMADEVATLRPWALGPKTPEGYATVDYTAL